MSYRRAWLLVDELNAIFAEPVVRARKGGAGGGGSAVLTPWGQEVLRRYRGMTASAVRAVEEDLAALKARLRSDVSSRS
jgi:molybdate transport system regulatory protein